MNNEQINTRTAWRPILKPVARFVIAAQLALVLQPLSAIAHEKGERLFNPVGDAQVQRLAQLDQRMQQARVQKAAAAAKSPADRVSDKLHAAEELVHKLKRAGTPDRAGKHRELKMLLADVNTGAADVKREFAATREHLKARGLPAVILKRHDDAAALVDERAARFAQIASISGDEERVAQLEKFFAQHPTQRKAMPLGKKLPWSTPEPNKRMPAETKTAWFRNLYGDQKV
jgi:hypothetical protein